ncbi:MAG: hypothetical protein ACRDY4_06330 [Acidimicrobiia bacterium]
MVRWIVSFAIVLFFLCILYYVVRLRTTPEDEIKESRREASDRRRGQAGDTR